MLASLVLLIGPGSATGAEGASPQLAFVHRGDLWIADADGSSAQRLTTTKPNPYWIAWSPDGRKIAFSSPHEDVRVINSDGTGERQLSVRGGEPVWSPDGTRIVIGARPDIWVMSADGSNAKRLTSDSWSKYAVQWRSSTEIIYEAHIPIGTDVVSIWSAAIDRGTPRVLVRGGYAPALSPDRSRLAYLAPFNKPATVYIASASGGARARPLPLPRGRANGPLVWSPDGARIAVQLPSGLWTIDPTSGARSQLTGAGWGPIAWWPGGERLFIGDGYLRGTSVVDASGDCEQPYRPAGFEFSQSGPRWRPGARQNVVPFRCVDLRARTSLPRSVIGRWEPVRGFVTIRNSGNLNASNVRVLIGLFKPEVNPRSPYFPHFVGADILATTSQGACDPVEQDADVMCELGAMEAGTEARVAVSLVAEGFGWIPVYVRAVSRLEPDVLPDNDEVRLTTIVEGCDILGTPGNDALFGTPLGEHICGGPGADRIDGRRGDDLIDAGNGADTIFAGYGYDEIQGRGGSDMILVRDGARDFVTCGTGRDTVIADRRDRLAGDCERVRRR